MATKITSDCHGRQDFTITDTCPSDCDMWGSFHLLLFHKHDILSCLFVNVCQWLWLKAWGRKAQRSCCVVCAKWRLDVLGTIHVFAHPTPLVLSVSVLDWKGSYIFLCVFGCVFPRFFLTNELHTEHYTSTVWIVMFCVSCHQNQVILLKLLQDWRNLLVAWVMRLDAGGTFWTKHFVVIVWFRTELTDVVMCCTQPKRVFQIGTERAWHKGLAHMASHLNRVCDHRERQHLRECWIPWKQGHQQANPWQEWLILL